MDRITVCEKEKHLTFTFMDMMRYHGWGCPLEVVYTLKALQAASYYLSPSAPLERRNLIITCSLNGPGVHDALELVTRAVTDTRFRHDQNLSAETESTSGSHALYR